MTPLRVETLSFLEAAGFIPQISHLSRIMVRATGNASMADAPELDLDLLETLYVDGVEIPFMDFGPVEPTLRLRLQGEEYAFRRSYPRRGFGGVLGKEAHPLLGEGKKLLVARFGDRHYLFER